MEKDSHCLLCLQLKSLSSSNSFKPENVQIAEDEDVTDKSLLLLFVVECFVDSVDLNWVGLISNLSNQPRLFCCDCFDVISNAFKVHKQVLELQKKLYVLKDNLRQRLKSSNPTESTHLSDKYVQLRNICKGFIPPTLDDINVKVKIETPETNAIYESDGNFDENDDSDPDLGDQFDNSFENVEVSKSKCISPDFIQTPEEITRKSPRTRGQKRKSIVNSDSEDDAQSDDHSPPLEGNTSDPDFSAGDSSDSDATPNEDSEDDSEPEMNTRRTTRTTPINSSLKCPTCGVVSITSKAFRAHQALHKANASSTCEICNVPCVSETGLAAHYLTQHPSIPLPARNVEKKRYKKKMSAINQTRVECEICHKRCLSSRIDAHVKLHESTFTCEFCTFSALSLPGLRKHQTFKHPEEKALLASISKKGWKCPRCPFVAFSKGQKNSHRSMHRQLQYAEKTPDNLVKCTLCSETFTHNTMFIRHFSAHSDTIRKAYLTCTQCNETFSNRYLLRRHQDTAHRTNNFPCEICGRGFHKIAIRNRHMETHKPKQPDGPAICEVCGATFKNRGGYKTHMSINHADLYTREKSYNKSRAERVECSVCKKMCIKSSLANHMKLHERTISCEICSFKVTAISGLRKHFLHKHPGKHPMDGPGEFRWKCDECDFVAFSRHSKCSHVAKHVAPDYLEVTEKGKFCCKLCSEVFRTEALLSIHLRVKHGQQIRQADLTCSECGEVLPTKRKLVRHLNSAHNQKQFQCDQCGMGFQDKSIFEDHVAKHEDPNAEIKCDKCGLPFFNRRTLMVHKYRYHKETPDSSKPKKVRKNASKKPTRIISSQKCGQCGEECCNLRALRAHMREAHPELYKFKCDICSATFPVVHRLNEHVKLIHESEKAKCPHCEIVFNNARGVKHHLMRGTCKKMKVDVKINVDDN